MSLRVLKTKKQIEAARMQLEQQGISCLKLEPEIPRTLFERLLGRRKYLSVGDHVKSWDVLETASYLKTSFAKNARVLDIGAFNCEILPMLHRAGFTDLTGIDLNAELTKMPYAKAIKYVAGNFMHTPFEPNSFDVVTAISVIEHGFDGAALLKELSRILAPGGVFIASFDYWPQKIDTTGTLFFDMSWSIFSQQEMQDFVTAAESFGMLPVGALDFAANEATIHCANRDYTFGWIALQKS